MGQRLFWGQMRLGLLLNSTDATTYWQKRAGILDKRHLRIIVAFAISSPLHGFPLAKKRRSFYNALRESDSW
jgi:hypothetical protein